jgi:hypothetical protein
MTTRSPRRPVTGRLQNGKDATEFVSALAGYATRAVRSGRRLCGQLRANDVLSELAQRRHGFMVQPLPCSTTPSWEVRSGTTHSQQHFNAYEERLRDNTVTPPPDAAAFRIDFPKFLDSLTDRDRRLAEFLSLGHQARKAADRFGLSPGRVTQLRQRWCQEWRVFQGEERADERTHRTVPRTEPVQGYPSYGIADVGPNSVPHSLPDSSCRLPGTPKGLCP